VQRVLQQAVASRGVELEGWETAIRQAALSAGGRVLGSIIDGLGAGRQVEPAACPDCGQRMVSRGRRTKRLVTVLGDVPYHRTRLQCPACGRSLHPGDELLDVVGTTRSPGLRRLMARAGSKSTFKEGRDDLKVYAGIRVSAKDVERVAEGIGADVQSWLTQERRRWLAYRPVGLVAKTLAVLYVEADGTGVPMMREELVGRRGKQADGSARTREAKLGCVFTQTLVARDGRPSRDPASTSFVGAIESAEDFGWRLYAESLRRGLHQARRVVLLGDGAEWINTLHATHWPEALRIVDLYHAREHLAELCQVLFAGHDNQIAHHRIRWWADLDAGRVEKITKEAQGCLPASAKARDEAVRQIAYLDKNKEHMRYAQFRRQGLFVGSGVIEAGCGTVIGLRMKQSGMEWSVRGANAIIALRCMMVSGRLEDYWQSRVG
jgi:predicted RNA-binding Zn-ribbon protein involved in translation (DUF1610 family)